MLPILYQSPELVLYSYPLFMGLAWGVAYQIFFSLVPSDVRRRDSMLLFWGMFLFSWLGAKVLFYFTIPTSAQQGLLVNMSFWTGGGFVFYGGLLGGLLFVYLYRFFGNKVTYELIWPMLPALVIGHGIGRIGCLLAGCCYGNLTDCWWGIYLHGEYRHPTQLIEASFLFGLGFYLLRSTRPKRSLVCHYLVIYGALRFGIEKLRGDDVRGIWFTLTPSQWISLVLIAVGLGLWMKHKSRVFSVN